MTTGKDGQGFMPNFSPFLKKVILKIEDFEEATIWSAVNPLQFLKTWCSNHS